MKSLHRAELIGSTTGGGANPGGPVRVNEHPYTKTNWEGVGIAPDVPAKDSDALLVGYKEALRALHPTFGLAMRDRDMAMHDPLSALNIALPALTAPPEHP